MLLCQVAIGADLPNINIRLDVLPAAVSDHVGTVRYRTIIDIRFCIKVKTRIYQITGKSKGKIPNNKPDKLLMFSKLIILVAMTELQPCRASQQVLLTTLLRWC